MEETEDENFGSVARPVARKSSNGRENQMATGQCAGIAKKTVFRNPAVDLVARDTGRPPTVSEGK